LFVVAVGGLGYLIIELIVSRLLGAPVTRVVAVSVSIIIAVIVWTIFIWIAGDRLGRRKSARGRDE
jgi:uncharacterized membrane protein YbhN (UPF0104 family)